MSLNLLVNKVKKIKLIKSEIKLQTNLGQNSFICPNNLSFYFLGNENRQVSLCVLTLKLKMIWDDLLITSQLKLLR